jgi:hypothetical protein
LHDGSNNFPWCRFCASHKRFVWYVRYAQRHVFIFVAFSIATTHCMYSCLHIVIIILCTSSGTAMNAMFKLVKYVRYESKKLVRFSQGDIKKKKNRNSIKINVTHERLLLVNDRFKCDTLANNNNYNKITSTWINCSICIWNTKMCVVVTPLLL